MQPLRIATFDDAAAMARVKIVGWRSTYSEWIDPELLTGMWPAPWARQHAIEEAVYRWTDLDQLLARSAEPFR